MQKEIVVRCRQAGKPVIVASHLLQSMIEYPTPTRAEVCLMLEHLRAAHDKLGSHAEARYLACFI